ncbi:MAG: CPBP family intramembrane metalloprotease [Promethearchaeota archaeon]|nr:MAG: CPBP family intramembrane metalloprotease [Candidatus Lokiarchaeota archaeon]
MNTLMRDFYERTFAPQREQSWFMIIGSYIVNCILVIALLFFAYPYGWFNPIVFATKGIINSTLLGSLAIFLVILVFMIRLAGKVKFTNMGLVIRQIPIGLLVLGVIYIAINLILYIVNVILKITPIWYPYWVDVGSFSVSLGFLIAQIFGNVLFEEVYYRGLLWGQLSIKFTKIFKNKPVLGLNIGALVANLLFALMHIPNRVLNGILGWNLILSLFIVFGLGYLFSLAYLITDSLFVSMALHILINVSFALFFPIYDTSMLCIMISFVMLLIWTILKLTKSKSAKIMKLEK